MEKLILEFHDWMALKPDDDNEVIALFNFSLMPEELRRSGKKPEHTDCFWTEVKLQRFLAEQPGWRALSKTDKIKAMFQYAVEQVREAGRKVRHLELFWTPTSRHRKGPVEDPKSIRFPKAPPVIIEKRDETTAPRFLARKAAGLTD